MKQLAAKNNDTTYCTDKTYFKDRIYIYLILNKTTNSKSNNNNKTYYTEPTYSYITLNKIKYISKYL